MSTNYMMTICQLKNLQSDLKVVVGLVRMKEGKWGHEAQPKKKVHVVTSILK